jgi:hypothetical protein
LKLRAGGRFRLLFTGLAAAAALALPLAALSAPAAQASISSADWSPVTLPDPIAPGEPSALSCVPGSSFCLVVAPIEDMGQTVVVTTDAGASWQEYDTLPTSIAVATAVSCATTSQCWVAGYNGTGGPALAESTDGGQTWMDVTPAGWPSGWRISALDCVAASTCWLAGDNFGAPEGVTPVVAATTDGTDWTTFTNLPVIQQYDPNGTYQLNTISCTSALDCVAGGGLNEADGLAEIISTTDGGATWTQSTDPVLTGLQQIFQLSCLPQADGLPSCYAAADALAAAGPVIISSADGGATWSGMETYDDTGWMSSVNCPAAGDCWAGGAGTTVGLVGTDSGGNSWSTVTSDTSDQEGTVDCPSLGFCLAATDNALWVSTDFGGLAPDALTAAKVSRRLPQVSGASVSAREGQSATVTGQYRRSAAKTAVATITTPAGKKTTVDAAIGLNGYYTVSLGSVAAGATSVTVDVDGSRNQAVTVHGYPAAAPAVRSLSALAGPAGGGTTITLKGSGFTGATEVLFGTRAGTHLKVVSGSELTVRTPAGSGARYVTVVTRNGGPSALTGHAVFNFLPQPSVTKVTPASGPAQGGRTVTLSGTGLAFVTAVRFGSKAATHLQVLSEREIRVTTPPGSGRVAVRVATAGGQSAVGADDYYTY